MPKLWPGQAVRCATGESPKPLTKERTCVSDYVDGFPLRIRRTSKEVKETTFDSMDGGPLVYPMRRRGRLYIIRKMQHIRRQL